MNPETPLMNRIMLALSKHGVTVWRNNCGVARYSGDRCPYCRKPLPGDRVRYGIANPGGSDVIGLTPVLITPEHVGRSLPVFTAVEVKRPGVEPNEDQERFLNFVSAQSGIAVAAHSEAEAIGAIDAAR